MPSLWFIRTFEPILSEPAAALRLFPVWLLLGQRQVGKSALLRKIAGSQRTVIDLDDLAVRARANTDPILFARDLQLPCVIDEIQYAPQLLSEVKRLADKGVPPGSIILTGSQNFEVMQGVRETLAGRVAILNLLGLSDEEHAPDSHVPARYFAHMMQSSFPRLADLADTDARSLYLSSYVQTYIERDVRELMGISKRREFELFVRAAAIRTGQLVNHAELAQLAGVSAATIKQWLSLLEDSFLIKLVQPYFSNRNKRLIKSPKLYFLDTGLAAYLAGWRDSEMLRLSPMAGAFFETHVFGQILRYFKHRAREVEVHFFRTRDGLELDFLVEHDGVIDPIEIKMGTPDVRQLAKIPDIAEVNWRSAHVLSLTAANTNAALSEHWQQIGPDRLGEIFIR
jgi:uncharacterized protein